MKTQSFISHFKKSFIIVFLLINFQVFSQQTFSVSPTSYSTVCDMLTPIWFNISEPLISNPSAVKPILTSNNDWIICNEIDNNYTIDLPYTERVWHASINLVTNNTTARNGSFIIIMNDSSRTIPINQDCCEPWIWYNLATTNTCIPYQGYGTITLSGSDTDASYQLFRNDVSTGPSKTGTGSPLSWGSLTFGTYKVYATNVCETSVMNNDISLYLKPEITAVPTTIYAGDSYILPDITGNQLTTNQGYYTGSGGAGTRYNVGSTIYSTPSTFYMYDNNNGCSDQKPISISITKISYSASSYCINNSTIQTPTISGLTGGTFSSTAGLSIGQFFGDITPSSSAAGTYIITYKVTNPLGGYTYAHTSVTITQLSNGGSITGAQTICSQPNSATINLTGNNGSVLRWEYSPNNTSWNSIANPTTSLSVANLTALTYYRAIVQNGVCPSVGSAPTTVSVVSDPSLSQPFNVITCKGISTTLSTTPSGGTGDFNYQWKYCSTADGTYNNVSSGTPTGFNYSGENTNSLTITGNGSSVTNYYKCFLTTNTPTGAGCNATTNAITVTVNPPPATNLTVGISSNPICYNSSTNITVASSVSGTSYQLRNGSTNVGSAVAGTGLTINLPTGNLTATTTFNVLATITATGCSAELTQTATVTLKTNSVVPASAVASPSSVVSGVATNITLAASGGELGTGAVVIWYSGSCGSGGGGTSIYVGTGNPLTVSQTLSSATTYYAYYEGDCNTTSCATSNQVSIKTISVAPTSATASPTSVCSGVATDITLTAFGGTLGTNAVVKWYTGSCGGTLVGTGNPLTVSPSLSSATTYYARYEGDCNTTSCASSNQVSIKTISVAPTSATVSPSSVCYGVATNITLTASGGTLGTNAVVKWYTGSCGGTLVGIGNPWTGSQTLTSTTTYFACYSGDCNTTTCKSPPPLTVNATPTGGTATANPSSICANYTSTISLTGYSGSSIQWKQSSDGTNWANVSGGSGATTATYITPALNSTTYYMAVVSNGSCTSNSNSVLITINATPYVASVTGPSPLCNGGTETYIAKSVALNGGTGSWISSNPAVATISSSDGVTAQVTGVTSGQSIIQYTITGGCTGGNRTASLLITVASDPAITTQPITPPSAVCVGGSFSALSVGATGGKSPYSYKWYSNTSNSYTNATPIPGATSINYKPLTNISGTTYYFCEVRSSGTGCNAVKSNIVEAQVAADPNITTQPVSPTPICVGGSASLSVGADGGNELSFQWQYYKGSVWNPVSNGNPLGAEYNIDNSGFEVSMINTPGSYRYRCVVTSSASGCNQVISSEAIITVNADPTISISPATPDEVCIGGTVSTLYASVSGGVSYEYQWYSNSENNNTGGTPISGAQSSSYTPPSTESGTTYYYCVLNSSDSGCESKSSNISTVNVNSDPVIDTQPASDDFVCIDGWVTKSISASGVSFMWKINKDGSFIPVTPGYPAGANYSDRTLSDLTISGITATGTYTYICTVSTRLSGCDVNSDYARVTVNANVGIPSKPMPFTSTICQGSANTTYTTSVANYNECAWSVTGANNTISGTGTTGTVSWDSGFSGLATVSVTANGCGNSTSASTTVYVRPTATASISGTTTVCKNVPSPTITISNPRSLAETITYSINNVNQPTILVAPNSSATVTVPTTTTGIFDYKLVSAVYQTAPPCSNTSFTNGTATVTVNAIPAQPGGSSTQTYCSGTGKKISDLTVTLTGQNITWYDASSGGNILSANTNLVNNTTYYATQTVSGCESTPRKPVTVTIQSDVVAGAIANDQSICNGGDPTAFTSTTNGTGSGTITYRWERSLSPFASWNVIAGASNPTFDVPSGLTETTKYHRITISTQNGNVCESSATADVTVTVVNDPSITTQPVGGSICTGGTHSLSIVAAGGISLSYQWYKDGILIPGATGSSYEATLNGNYYCIVSSNGSGCGGVQSNSVNVTVNADPVAETITGTQASGTNICIGGTVSATFSGGSGGAGTIYDYYEYSVNGGSSWTSYAPENNVTSTSTGANRVKIRTWRTADGDGCDDSFENTVQWTVVNDPAITSQPTGGTICSGGTHNLSIVAAGGISLSYKWYKDGSFINGAIGSSYGATITGDYYCVVSSTGNGCGTVQSNTVHVTVNPLPTLTGASQVSTVCAGSPATINLTGLLSNSTSSVSYSINGAAQAAVAGVVANASGAASFTTAALTAANNGQTLQITGITTTSATPNCSKTFAQDVALSVYPTSAGGTISPSQTICSGTSPIDLTLGGHMGAVLKWQKSSDVSFTTPTDIAETKITLAGATIGNLATSTYFRAVVQSGTCSQAYSLPVLITVNPTPTLTGASQASTVCAGSPATINLTGVLSNSTSSVSYSINGVDQTAIAGVVANASGTASFTTAALTAANNGQTLQVTGITTTSSTPNCSKTFNNIQTQLIVKAAPDATGEITGIQTQCPGLSGQVYSIPEEVESATLTWEVPEGWVINNGQGTISIEVTTGSADQNGIIKVIAENSCGTSSSNLAVTVNSLPTLSNLSKLCSSDLLTYSISFTTNGVVTLPGYTVENGTISGVPAETDVTLTVTLNNCVIEVFVEHPVCTCPTIDPPTAEDQSFCGDIIPDMVEALKSNPPEGCTSFWYREPEGGSELDKKTPLESGFYYAGSINDLTKCKSLTRTKIYVTVKSIPSTPTTDNPVQTFCSASNPKVSDIKVNEQNIIWHTVKTGVGVIMDNPLLVNGTTYYASQTDGGCESPTRLEVTVTVSPNVTAGNVSGTTPLSIGATATFTSDGTSGGSWNSSNPLVAAIDPLSGVVSAISTGSTDITYKVSSGCGSPIESEPLTLTVNQICSPYTVTINNLTQCGDTKGSITANGLDPNKQYQYMLIPKNEAEKPIITLTGDNPLTWTLGETFVDPGATAYDIKDGDITASIVTINNVDVNVVGSYTVTYNVTDSDGNAAEEVSRGVNVEEVIDGVFTMTTTSTSATWSPQTVVNSGATLHWEVTGAVTTSTDANDPTFDFSAPGEKVITITSNDDFAGVTWLNCQNNFINTLDVSGLINLEYLLCNINQLTSLDLRGLNNLTVLHCGKNSLSSLNLTGLTNITLLYCYSNYLTSLDVTGMGGLIELECYSNSLTTLDVRGLINLEALICSNNQITNLKVTGLSNLYELSCNNNNLSSLNLIGLSNISQLNFQYNSLTSLDVTGLSNLNQITCNNNNLSSLNLTGLSNLRELYGYNNYLTNLDVTGMGSLFRLECYANSLTSTSINSILDQLIVNGNSGGYLLDLRYQTPTAYADAAKVAALDAIWNNVYCDIAPPSVEEVTIGTQTWMLKNLDIDDGLGGIYVYGGNVGNPDYETNLATYGRLYTWGAAVRVAATVTGWHLPSSAEYSILQTYLGGQSVAGGKMKETGYNHWNSPNTGATNESGFTALGAGGRASNNTYLYLKSFGFYWTSISGTRYAARSALAEFGRTINVDVADAFSVRLIKD